MNRVSLSDPQGVLPVESATEKGSAWGCLMVCVAPLVNDAEVQRFQQRAAAGGVALVERRFRDGICAADIPPDFPVAVRAIQVTDFARGLTMRARIGTKTLLNDAEEAAGLVVLLSATPTNIEREHTRACGRTLRQR
jgi:hypothetical protein